VGWIQGIKKWQKMGFPGLRIHSDPSYEPCPVYSAPVHDGLGITCFRPARPDLAIVGCHDGAYVLSSTGGGSQPAGSQMTKVLDLSEITQIEVRMHVMRGNK